MKYIHSMWSKPATTKSFNNENDNEKYLINGFYLNLLSILLIKKMGHEFDLYCDEYIYKYYKSLPYNKIHVIDFGEDGINSKIWNWAKIKSQMLVNEPYVHIDTDVFIFRDIIGDRLTNGSHQAVVQSLENEITIGDTFYRIYLKHNPFLNNKNIDIDWFKHNMWGYNCGVMGFSDMELKNKYLNQVKQIFVELSKDKDFKYNKIKYDSSYMIAEQSVLYYVLKENDTKVLEIIPYDYILKNFKKPYDWTNSSKDIGYTHMWSYSKHKSWVIDKIKIKIKKFFPDYYYLVDEFESKNKF